MRERRTKIRRVGRETTMKHFLKQQVLLRSYLKRNVDKKMEDRLDLAQDSSEDDSKSKGS